MLGTLCGRANSPLVHQSLLREMGEKFSFQGFKQKLEEKKKGFNPMQLSGLKQRMALLEGFLQPSLGTARFKKGRVTIVDLTDPFIDPASACSIFEVVTRLFVRSNVETGKVLVLDEAHKVRDGTSRSTKMITDVPYVAVPHG